MNLHIVPDSKFSNTFYHNLKEIGLLDNNSVVARTNHPQLKYITADVPFARLYSSKFDQLTGDTHQYEKVFIHQLAPLMYRWIATHRFKLLNWMVWGTDLYNLPFVSHSFYESWTQKYTRRHKKFDEFFYLLKVYLTSMPFKSAAYSKVNNVLTWMKSEYAFAHENIPTLKAEHQFFFYENQIPYHALDGISFPGREPQGVLKIIIGNSGTPTNNHLDAIKTIHESGIRADLSIPVSYGEPAYIAFLKKSVSFYSNGTIEFVDRFMEFNEYVQFLGTADALVMNHIRPQGYGNILMMMYLGKPVFLNEKNISIPDLDAANIEWRPLNEIRNLRPADHLANRENVSALLAHSKLVETYTRLFS
jgi:dTDP-N-acetylfucosamine:lipid II N-acetylfucosaminyltransferase